MSYNGRNIKNDKCSTKLDVLQNVNLQSIEPVLLIKKLWIISLKEFFLVKFTKSDSSTRFLATSVEQLFCRTYLGGCFYETEHYKDFTVAALFFTKDKLLKIIVFHISAKRRYLVALSHHFFFCLIKN